MKKTFCEIEKADIDKSRKNVIMEKNEKRYGIMINACVVGLGGRGYSLVCGVLLKNKDVNILAVCDVYEDRVARGVKAVQNAGMNVKGFTDYKEALNTAGIDTVFVFTDWSTHAEIAI